MTNAEAELVKELATAVQYAQRVFGVYVEMHTVAGKTEKAAANERHRQVCHKALQHYHMWKAASDVQPATGVALDAIGGFVYVPRKSWLWGLIHERDASYRERLRNAMANMNVQSEKEFWRTGQFF